MELKKPCLEAPHTLSGEEIASLLETSPESGLHHQEAERRLKKFGLNSLPEPKPISAWTLFLRQFCNFMVIVLLVAMALSIAVGSIKDAFVIFAIVMINAIIGYIQESKAERALESLRKMASPQATVLRDGEVHAIPADTLVLGDVVLLDEGSIVPADLRMISLVGMEINESMLTGEAAAASKQCSPLSEAKLPLGERTNLVFMGTTVNVGNGRGIVVATGSESQMGRIAQSLAIPVQKPTPLQIKLAELGRVLVYVTLALCIAVGLIGLFQGRGAKEMSMTSISLAVAVIPEGLVVVVTITMALGVQRMARRKAVVRNLHSVEVLGSVTTICSDKTGTLTEGKMSATNLYAGGHRYDIGYCSADDHRVICFEDRPLETRTPPLNWMLKISALCNNAVLQLDENDDLQAFGDSTDMALQILAAKTGDDKNHLLEAGWQILDGIPFDSDRKRMSMTCVSPDGETFSLVKGGVEAILSISTRAMSDSGNSIDLGELHSASQSMAAEGLRVLALGFRQLEKRNSRYAMEELESNLTCVGLIGISDPPRKEARVAISKCHQAGIQVVMVTGDHVATASSIAKQIGILRDKNASTISGAEMDELSLEQLGALDPSPCVVARVSPENKLMLVQALQQKGQIVAMTGDGVNDAPAIKHANIGLAMGIAGTDVTKQAADIVLSDDNFATIVIAVEEGRRIYENINHFIVFLLTINAAQLFVILIAIPAGFPVPFTPIQNLWLNIVTGTPPALALGFLPATEYLMRRAPRSPNEPILNRLNSGTIVFHGVLISLLSLGMFLVEVYIDHEPLDKARTASFAMLAVLQMAFAFIVVRNTGVSYWQALLKYRFLDGAVLISLTLLLLGIYAPFLSTLFGHANLYFKDWTEIAGAVAVFVLCSELFRLFQYRSKE